MDVPWLEVDKSWGPGGIVLCVFPDAVFSQFRAYYCGL
jgi:hypothetical protein